MQGRRPPPYPARARSRWEGDEHRFSQFISDLGQGVGWHQAPLLATADADEAVSILAPAHTHTDLRGGTQSSSLTLFASPQETGPR